MFNNDNNEFKKVVGFAESFIGEFFNDDFNPGKFIFKNHLATDLKELDNKFVLTIELAGFKKENITVEYNDSNLLIKAVSKDNSESIDGDNVDYKIKERSSEDVSRTFNIPFIEDSTIEASFENGVLTVELFKIKNDGIKKHISIK